MVVFLFRWIVICFCIWQNLVRRRCIFYGNVIPFFLFMGVLFPSFFIIHCILFLTHFVSCSCSCSCSVRHAVSAISPPTSVPTSLSGRSATPRPTPPPTAPEPLHSPPPPPRVDSGPSIKPRTPTARCAGGYLVSANHKGMNSYPLFCGFVHSFSSRSRF